MKRISRTLITLLCLLCSTTLSAIRTNNLKCEMLDNPCGIGTTQPHLSWQIPAERRGIGQKAYYILAASTPEKLNEKDADLWNSGRIDSDQSIWVRYEGKPLTSRSVVYWKVKVWDEQNQESGWSATARFTVGLLEQSDWHGRYIGMERSDTTISPLLWKTFRCTKNGGAQAFLHISTLGFHEVYLNGRRVGNDVLAPSVVVFTKRSQAMSYDVTSLLRDGENDIVVWLGKGFYDAAVPGGIAKGPYVMAQIDVQDGAGWTTAVATDRTWRARKSGYYLPGTWARNRFDGEVVKAEELLPDMSHETLAAAQWDETFEASIPPRTITPMMCEPNRIKDALRPQGIRQLSPGTWMIDMGKSVVGWTKIRMKDLQKGQTIGISYCDMLGLNGEFEYGVFSDRYIARGEGEEYFENKFNYHAYRYIKITGLTHAPDFDDVTSYLIHTGYDNRSSFICNDEDINAIHNMIHYTFECLTQSGYMVDCPHLERGGYGGDGNSSTLAAQLMYDLYPLYVNWMQAYGDEQSPDGDLPHTAPSYTRCGGGPYWLAFIAHAPWQTYQQYGDKDILAHYYPYMKRFAEFAEGYMPDGLLAIKNRWPNNRQHHWFLGDWALPNEVHQHDESSIDIVNSCSMSWVYGIIAKTAAILGKPDEQKVFAQKQADINSRIHETFYHAKESTYSNGLQLDLAFPLFVGATPEKLREKVNNSLRDLTYQRFAGHFFTGLVGIPILTQWLTRAGEAQLMYDMLKKRSFPGYLYMIENGATTTWEHWDARRSRIHNCYNGIGSWFYQALAGIVNDEEAPAYRHFFIRPQIPDGIRFVRCCKPTPYGDIVIDWTLSGKTFDLKVSVPAGTTATVEVPFQPKTVETAFERVTRRGLVYDDKQQSTDTGDRNTVLDASQPIVLVSGRHRLIYTMK
ncbi:MAG: glycoside hydrolase family 78 protein [Bacteroidaceae bacterium]|nr:glycoside hydrolase family 78 protein [Bacteroidaceae bacterium]